MIADSKTGYTCDFSVYIGKEATPPNNHGLGYNVVMNLSQPYYNQGFHIFFENFYTSTVLVTSLYDLGTPSYGTVTENRKGLPVVMGKLGQQVRTVELCNERITSLL